MANYTPPKTRKKPTDTTTTYDVDTYNTFDGITHVDDAPTQQEYTHNGEHLTLKCLTDIDLAGQPATRQSTSAYTLFLNGHSSIGEHTQRKSLSKTLPPENTLPLVAEIKPANT